MKYHAVRSRTHPSPLLLVRSLPVKCSGLKSIVQTCPALTLLPVKRPNIFRGPSVPSRFFFATLNLEMFLQEGQFSNNCHMCQGFFAKTGILPCVPGFSRYLPSRRPTAHFRPCRLIKTAVASHLLPDAAGLWDNTHPKVRHSRQQ